MPMNKYQLRGLYSYNGNKQNIAYRSCRFLAVLVKNVSGQNLHLKGCSPKWRTRSCSFFRCIETNCLSQKEQAKSFWPVWRTICNLKLYVVLKDFPHSVQSRDRALQALLLLTFGIL